MSSTLYRADHLAPVIRLTERRAGATLLVRVGLVSDDVVYRWVGIDEDATIADCCEIVGEVFGVEGVGADAPQGRLLCDVLKSPGDSTHFSHGLWSFECSWPTCTRATSPRRRPCAWRAPDRSARRLSTSGQSTPV